MTLSPERSAAYGTIALILILLLAVVWPSAPSAPPAQAQPIIVVATATSHPAWTPRPVPAPRDTLAVQVAPPTEAAPAAIDSTPAAGAADVPATVAEPPSRIYYPDGSYSEPGSQLRYYPDGDVRLPGSEDWLKNAPPEPTAMSGPTTAPAVRTGGCAARGPAAARFCKVQP